MDQTHSTITEHKKGTHLTYKDRVVIEMRLKDNYSPNKIAKEIGCAPNTIRNEIRRGTVLLYNGKVKRYKAEVGQSVYKENRKHCCRHYDRLEKDDFIKYVERHFKDDNWSLDACAGRAISDGTFTKDQIVCTKTLYNYVDLGLINIMNIDLPVKVKRASNNNTKRENKRILGRSIEERPAEANERSEFGHWECDLVIGAKTNDDDVLLTMLERTTREYLIFRIPDKTPKSVMDALKAIRSQYSEHVDEIFKTITTDNGLEFSTLSELEAVSQTLVYYAHPYTSCEKGSIERHNGLIRRFIPKGKRIDSYTNEQLVQIELWCNNLPRKQFDYKTPDELFEDCIDAIYSDAA